MTDPVEADQAIAYLDPAMAGLPIEDLCQLLARVATAPVPRYLLRGVMAEGDYGMLGAEFKAGKTWLVTDAAVSVASGTAWLGIVPVDAPGPVLVFAGEGGVRKLARRFEAVCEPRDLDPSKLPIRVCPRVPSLTSDAAMELVAAEIERGRPKAVIVDPLYLAARGAHSSDLFEMGAHLGRVQEVCQGFGAALLITHHWNLTGSGRGAKRMSGAGGEAWARVILSAAVESRRTDPATQASIVVLAIEVIGDEVPETTIRVQRTVWADDPEDLSSRVHYEVAAVGEAVASDSSRAPAAERVHAALASSAEWLDVHQVGDRVAHDGTGRGGLKRRTVYAALASLTAEGVAEKDGPRSAPCTTERAGGSDVSPDLRADRARATVHTHRDRQIAAGVHACARARRACTAPRMHTAEAG